MTSTGKNATERSDLDQGERPMLARRRARQTDELETRLALRNRRSFASKSKRFHPLRDQILRKAPQAETGSQMSEWLRSPGLRPPDWIRQALRAAVRLHAPGPG